LCVVFFSSASTRRTNESETARNRTEQNRTEHRRKEQKESEGRSEGEERRWERCTEREGAHCIERRWFSSLAITETGNNQIKI
jgi:hypothetical protein